MSDQMRSDQLDDFWDISDLVPKQSARFGYARSTESVPVVARQKPKASPPAEESSTVIRRYIPPNSAQKLTDTECSYEHSESYVPAASLIHRVTVKKLRSSYRYYEEFSEDAKRYQDRKGSPCDYVPFFSYVPQYNQMSEAQLAYYFWFRDCFLRGERIRIDYSYVLLLVYERINLGSSADVKESQWILTELWRVYHKEFPGLLGKLAEWICDFSLIHRLPPPENADGELVRHVPTLKEFYIPMPDYDVDGCVRSLLKFCSSYDYRTSKFAEGENLALFEKHIPAALCRAVAYYSDEGKILSGLTFEDSRLAREAYAGALCSADQRHRLELQYCSFSRSNELRFLVGDVVKYAENKIRAYLSIKSRMTVYSIPTDLQRRLDEYFAQHLPGKKPLKPKQEKQAYDVLYELPKKEFSLKDAAKIEEESWQTTDKLISTFEIEELQAPVMPKEEPVPKVNEQEESDLRTMLGDYLGAVLALLDGHSSAVSELAGKLGQMPDALADRINEIAFECIGDALLEESDGGYAVIEDYREYLNER